MTDLRKAAEMLMKALDDGWVERGDNVAIALRQALAQTDETETLKRCLFQMQEAAKALAQPEQERLSLRLDVGGGIARAAAACGDQIQSVAHDRACEVMRGLNNAELSQMTLLRAFAMGYRDANMRGKHD